MHLKTLCFVSQLGLNILNLMHLFFLASFYAQVLFIGPCDISFIPSGGYKNNAYAQVEM